jgi:hypothetical protein
VPHLDGLGELYCFKWSFQSAVELWEPVAHLYYHAASPGLAPHLLLHIRQLTQAGVTLGQQGLAQAEREGRGEEATERETRGEREEGEKRATCRQRGGGRPVM